MEYLLTLMKVSICNILFRIKIVFVLLLISISVFAQTAPEITGNSLRLPKLTNSQRDTNTPTEGQIIYNSTTKQLEFYDGTKWNYLSSFQSPTIVASSNLVNLKQNENGSIRFTLTFDSKLTASYVASCASLTIANPSGSVSSSPITINFSGSSVGTHKLNFTLTDSQGKFNSLEVPVSITPPQELTKTYVDSTLFGAYKSLLGWNQTWMPLDISPSNWQLELASDEYHKGTDPGDLSVLNTIELYQWDANNSVILSRWKNLYEAVKNANTAIRTVQAYLSKYPSEAAYAKQVEAEAVFLRAFFHFELYKIFKNIPYFTETDLSEYIASSQGSIVLTKIIQDLDKAVANLQPQRVSQGRIDKFVALAFKGKAHLFAAQYAQAQTVFNTVISSGKYSLNYDFHESFKEGSELTAESILQPSLNLGYPTYSGGFFKGDRLVLPYGPAPSSCCGFMTGSYDLGYSYRTDANGLPISTTNVSILRIPSGSSIQLDPRIDWTIGRTGVPYLDWGYHQDSWIRNGSYTTYYSQKKYSLATLSGARTGENLANINYNLMRYADLLLMAAECEAQVGSLETARQYVNLIRQRAGNTAQGLNTISVPSTSSQITWAKYKVSPYTNSWTDKTTALDAIKLERKLELAMEGHRLFDLQRWSDLERIMYPYINRERLVTNFTNGASISIAQKNYAFPIPQEEIDKSGGLLVQNPGY